VEFDVGRARVESETSERTQAPRETVRLVAKKHEVEMRDSDVIAPDVDLFHVPGSARDHLSYRLRGEVPVYHDAWRADPATVAGRGGRLRE
jgi:hypothetical protein